MVVCRFFRGIGRWFFMVKGSYPHKYKYGKQQETMDLKEFDSKLRKANLSLEYNSFLAFLYISGARLNEILTRRKEDFTVENNVLVIKIPSEKKGTRQFLEFNLDWIYVKEFILKKIEKTRGKNRKVWSFSERTARNLVKKVFGKQYYPHFFRLNAAVSFCRNKNTTIQDVKAWFGWRRIETINSYMGLSRRDISEARNKRGAEFEL